MTELELCVEYEKALRKGYSFRVDKNYGSISVRKIVTTPSGFKHPRHISGFTVLRTVSDALAWVTGRESQIKKSEMDHP